MIFGYWVGFKTYSRGPLWPFTFPESALRAILVLIETPHMPHTFILLLTGTLHMPNIFGNDKSPVIIRSGGFAL